jgi:starch phosphorylase
LLDTNIPENKHEFRHITAQLYGGDRLNRLRQELLLGIGGYRALLALGHEPSVCHMNEGHAAFMSLARIEHLMKDKGLSLQQAMEIVPRSSVFTTHTPVPAGNETFEVKLLKPHMEAVEAETGLSAKDFIRLSQAPESPDTVEASMTVLGMRMAKYVNGVSKLHGEVARQMWSKLWPGRAEDEVPIGHVTNGVHVPSWLAYPMQLLYDKYLGPDWQQSMGEPEVWQKIYDVDPGELWETHNVLKSRLLDFVRRRVSRQCRRRNENESAVEAARSMLNPNALTIGFARRFATYKRADLVLQNLDKFVDLISDPQRPVQFIFAGKAHPADEPGKKLIQSIANLRHDPHFAGRIVFVEDYDINVGRHLIQGVDVWLNNPRRPLEASGTSGQKVVLNGGLNCSVLDGWWAEAYNGRNGFAIGKGTQHVDPAKSDDRDARELLTVLADEVIPLFYERDADGLPQQWIERMTNSIATLAARFSAHRMVMDYVQQSYLVAAGGLSSDMNVR